MAAIAKQYNKQVLAGNVLRVSRIQGLSGNDVKIVNANNDAYINIDTASNVKIQSTSGNVNIDSSVVKLSQQTSLSPVTTDVSGNIG